MQEIILTSACKETINIIANVTLWLTSPGSMAGLLAPFREMRQRTSPNPTPPLAEEEKEEGPERAADIKPTREQDEVKWDR